MRKVGFDCTRTAAQLLRGQSILPPCEEVANAQLAQLVTEVTEEDKSATEREIDLAREAGEQSRITIKEAEVASIGRQSERWRFGVEDRVAARLSALTEAEGLGCDKVFFALRLSRILMTCQPCCLLSPGPRRPAHWCTAKRQSSRRRRPPCFQDPIGCSVFEEHGGTSKTS